MPSRLPPPLPLPLPLSSFVSPSSAAESANVADARGNPRGRFMDLPLPLPLSAFVVSLLVGVSGRGRKPKLNRGFFCTAFAAFIGDGFAFAGDVAAFPPFLPALGPIPSKAA